MAQPPLRPPHPLWELGADSGPKTCNKHAGLHVLGPLALRSRPLVPAERSAARLAHQSGGLAVSPLCPLSWRAGPAPDAALIVIEAGSILVRIGRGAETKAIEAILRVLKKTS